MNARSFAAAASVFCFDGLGRVARDVVFQVERDRAVEAGLGQQREERLPVDHALAHRAVLLPPAGRGLLPEEILQRDHRQPRRGQIERGAPAAVASFDHRVTHVEVVARPFRIERVDDGDDVPDVAADVARVVVEADAGRRCARSAPRGCAMLRGGRVALLPHVHERVAVVAGLEERNTAARPPSRASGARRDRRRTGAPS